MTYDDQPLKSTNQMLHEALDGILKQADKLDGQLGSINLALRYDSRVGTHVHAGATVRHRIHVTVTDKP